MDEKQLLLLSVSVLEKIKNKKECSVSSLYNYLEDLLTGMYMPEFAYSVAVLHGYEPEICRPGGPFSIRAFFGRLFRGDVTENTVNEVMVYLTERKFILTTSGKVTLAPCGKEYLLRLESELRESKIKMSFPRQSMYDGKAPYIYLSFSYKDTDAALEIAKILWQKGYRVCCSNDYEGFEKTRRSEAFIAIVSNNYVESLLCTEELNRYKEDYSAACLPIFIEEVNIGKSDVHFGGEVLYAYSSKDLEQDVLHMLRYKLAVKYSEYNYSFELDEEYKKFDHMVDVNAHYSTLKYDYDAATDSYIPQKEEPYVYISYEKYGIGDVYEIGDILDSNGYGSWFDYRVHSGAEWYQHVLEKIENCELVVAVISEGFTFCDQCRYEWFIATMFNKKILRVYLKEGYMAYDLEAEGESIYKYSSRNFEQELLYILKYREVMKKGAVLPQEKRDKTEQEKPQETPQPTEEKPTVKTVRNIKPYEGKKPYIFVSYSHQNRDSVFEIIETLQKNGYRVWYDEGIHPGTQWSDFIADKIANCSSFIAVMSQEFLDSIFCVNELSYGFKKRKNLLLVYLTDVELTGGMEMNYDVYQAIHKYKLSDDSTFGEKLMSAEGLDICKD